MTEPPTTFAVKWPCPYGSSSDLITFSAPVRDENGTA
jgi:hypothetical protein